VTPELPASFADIESTSPADLSEKEGSGRRTGHGGPARRSASWDIANAPRNYASLVATHVATAVSSFASVWIVTRYLGSAEYGSIIAIVAASQLAQIFLNWSSTSLARFGTEEFVQTGYITRSFWSRTLLFAPNLALILILSVFWLQPVSNWLKLSGEVVWLIAVHLAVTSVWLHIQYSLQGVKMLRLQGGLLAVERALTFAGLATLIAAGSLNLQNAIWCYIVPAIVLSFLGAFLLRNYVKFEGFFDRKQFRKMLVYSLPLIPFAIVGYLSTSQLDAFFITHYLTPRDLGIYAVASQINGLVLQFPILANTLLLSMFVSLKTSGQEVVISRFLNDVVPSASLLWGILCSVGVGVVSVLVPVVFGSEFQPAVAPLVILIFASVVSALSMFGYATYSHSISATYISTVASVLAAIVNVLLNLVLIPRWGLIGCAIASFVSQAVLGATVVGLCALKTSVNLRKAGFAIAAPIVAVGAFLFSGSIFVSVAACLATTAVSAMFLQDALKTTFAYGVSRTFFGKATTSN
jgi:O-antigen/teichoic acid export membrane protein